jgi:hypothetical protein
LSKSAARLAPFETQSLYDAIQRYLKGGPGGLVGFELAGGKEAGRRFIDALHMFYHVANIGDTRSDPHELEATGVTDGYVRDELHDRRAAVQDRFAHRSGRRVRSDWITVQGA